MAFAVHRTWLIAVLALIASTGPLQAEGFRIETKIFTGDEPEPVSTATTLFLDGIVYDFLANPQQTAVFRRATGGNPGRFILLYDLQRVKTEVTTDKLAGAMSKLCTWAAQQKDPFLQFAADPQFNETFDRDTGKLVLASHLETYTVTTSPTQHRDSLADYREFLDWYTQLNNLLITHQPPNPRLKLNDALARHKVVPKTVELKRAGQDPVRAEHDFTWRLSKDDLQRIEDVREAISSYRQVENVEFLKIGQQSAATK
jgi:hypothetical protein